MNTPVTHTTARAQTPRREDHFKAPVPYSSPEEKRVVESHKTSNVEDKMSALMAYRKAKGLCYKCGMK